MKELENKLTLSDVSQDMIAFIKKNKNLVVQQTLQWTCSTGEHAIFASCDNSSLLANLQLA